MLIILGSNENLLNLEMTKSEEKATNADGSLTSLCVKSWLAELVDHLTNLLASEEVSGIIFI